jgi:hypothetical protein
MLAPVDCQGVILYGFRDCQSARPDMGLRVSKSERFRAQTPLLYLEVKQSNLRDRTYNFELVSDKLLSRSTKKTVCFSAQVCYKLSLGK